MCAEMFLQVWQCREKLAAMRAVKRLSIMQSKMRSQTISSVEGFLATVFSAFERFDLSNGKCLIIWMSDCLTNFTHLRMNSHMNFQRVWSQKCFSAVVLAASKAKLAFMRLQMSPQIANRAVWSRTFLVIASVSGNYRRITSLQRIWKIKNKPRIEPQVEVEWCDMVEKMRFESATIDTCCWCWTLFCD